MLLIIEDRQSFHTLTANEPARSTELALQRMQWPTQLPRRTPPFRTPLPVQRPPGEAAPPRDEIDRDDGHGH
ncbi:MAG TPA: hypothetical protein VFY12_07760 [Arenimonas sp.]|nr:hypothetical protein [Arenimonas sp.]